MNTTYVIIWVVLVFVVYVISKYNWIISLRNNRQNAFADIDVQLKLRFDLLPNLVETVKWYASHEQAIYNEIMKARQAYSWAQSVDAKINANTELTWALWRLFAVVESNPELKANQNFLQLQWELSDIENKLAASRRFFNSSTNEYNTYIQSFPTNIVAWIFAFKDAQSFEVENRTELEKAPKISF